MITRPLDLASRLRPPPRPLAGLALYLVNVVLLAMFFFLFGSRFVLSPGLPVDFSLPVMPGAQAGAVATSMVITVKGADFIITEDGLMNLGQLRGWLKDQAQSRPNAHLLIKTDVDSSLRDFTAVVELAEAAGFQKIHVAAESGLSVQR